MYFSGIQPLTTVDFPGHLACVVFTPGCNMRCPFCHNPDSVLPERIQQQADDLIPHEALFGFLEHRQ